MPKKGDIKDRTGEINISKEGYEMKIIKYNGREDVIVEFQDKHKCKVHTQYKSFKSGGVKNPYYPSVFGVGYIGQGKYITGKNGKHTKCYITWRHMIERCYDPYTINKQLSYIDVFVCEEWHNFQNFAEWWYKHYYEVKGERMCVDKDILIKGNKIYSPETCMIVPERINNLFIRSSRHRGKYPIGVSWHKRNLTFTVSCNTLDNEGKRKTVHLGSYDNEIDAFMAYKRFKEKYIKEIANEYKDLIPKELYEALYRYEVEIND